MRRVLVYVAHLSLGARSGSRREASSGSPSIEAPPTAAAASGPKSTAAKSVGRSEIDCSWVRVNPRCDGKPNADSLCSSRCKGQCADRQRRLERVTTASNAPVCEPPGQPGTRRTPMWPVAADPSRVFGTLELSLDWGIPSGCRQFPIEESCVCRGVRRSGRSSHPRFSAGVWASLFGGQPRGNRPDGEKGCWRLCSYAMSPRRKPTATAWALLRA